MEAAMQEDAAAKPTMALVQGMHWQKVRVQGEAKDRPGHRLCHTLTPLPNNRLLLFGGWSGIEQRYNNLSIFDADLGQWSEVQATGDIPCARSTHTLTPINNGQQLLLFAGYKGGEERFDDLHLLDLGTLTWTKLDVPKPKPAPRNTHTAVLLADGRRLVVFGGRDEHNFYNDCWILDVHKYQWEMLTTSGELPRPRSGHSAVLVRDHSIIIFGGWGGGYRRFSDLFELNVDTGVWTNHRPTGDLPQERSGHTACLINPNLMMLFGGWGKCNYLADVHLLDLTTMRWRKVVPGGVPPETRRFHAMACLNETVYIYGGRNDEDHFKDLQCLMLGPRPLAALCVSFLVANYHRFDQTQMMQHLPVDVYQLVSSSYQLEQKRLRKASEMEMDEDDDDDDEEEDDEDEEEDQQPQPTNVQPNPTNAP